MKTVFTCLFLLTFSLTGFAQTTAPLKLWYNQPAGSALVYGNPEQEIIKLNEASVYAGRF